MKSRTEMRKKLFETSELDISSGSSLMDESGALDTLRTFQPVGKENTDALSNTFLFWESIPKYCNNGHEQSQERARKGYLESIKKQFPISDVRPPDNTMVMHPARIEDSETDKFKEYFPTFFDEKIERVLIKLYLDKDRGGFHRVENEFGAFVRFRIRDIRRMLAESGAQSSHADVLHSLRVLAGTRLEIVNKRGDAHKETILGSLTEPSDTDCYYVVRFNTIVSTAIIDRSYRQFPFETWMGLRRSLSRWLLLRMCSQKNLGKDFPHYVKASAALEAGVCTAQRPNDRTKAFYKAIEELRDAGVVTYEDKSDIRVNKIRQKGVTVDTEFYLQPTGNIVSHVISANGRDNFLSMQDQLKQIRGKVGRADVASMARTINSFTHQ